MSTTALVVLSDGQVHLACAQSVVSMVVSKTVPWAWFQQIGRGYLDIGRNDCVRAFNAAFEDCDRILMVDSDIEFTPEDIRILEDDDLPIVSGVYPSHYLTTKGPCVLPVVYEWQPTPDGRQMMEPITSWPDGPVEQTDFSDPIIEVDGIGAGFLMIKREVLDTMEARYGEPLPWFAEDVVDGIHFGEDLCFCIRARECGYTVYADRRVQVAHHKGIRLGGREVSKPVAV